MRLFYLALCCGTLGALALPAYTEAARPNLVLYVADDQGMNDAGCYGNSVVRTPGLDALAAEGTRYTHAFATTASCSPSRSVLLSGLHNHANGMYGLAHADHHFSSFDRVESLPARLAEAGYRTLLAGKYHVAPEAVYPFELQLPVRVPEEMAEELRAPLAAEDDRPFFLLFATVEPHRPFNRATAQPIDPAQVVVPAYLPDTPECREELAQYYMSIEQCDRGLARLVEVLKETGHYDDTVIVYLSDNGAPFPGAKTTAYEPGVRLPCVVRDPAAPARGATSDAMISWVDITPTLLDYAGLKVRPREVQGRSFRETVGGADVAGYDEVFLSHTFHEVTMYYPVRGVRTRQYKLLWNIAHPLPYPFASDLFASTTWQGVLERGDTHYGARTVDAYLHRPRFELYDLAADPGETHNLAEDPAHAEVLRDLQARLRQFQEETRDPWILKWERE